MAKESSWDLALKLNSDVGDSFAGEQHKCLQCGNFFGKAENLRSHMLNETEGKDLCCENCNEEFKSSFGTHNAEEQQKCLQCGNFFGKAGNLRRHMRNKSEGKYLLCGECNEEFKRSFGTHNGIHGGEKNKSLSQAQHLLTHTGEK